MVQLALPCRMIDLDPEHTVFHADGSSVFRDDGTHRLFPVAESLRLVDAPRQLRIFRTEDAQDIVQTTESHGGFVAWTRRCVNDVPCQNNHRTNARVT